MTVIKLPTEHPGEYLSTLWPSRENLPTQAALLLRWSFRAVALRKEEASRII